MRLWRLLGRVCQWTWRKQQEAPLLHRACLRFALRDRGRLWGRRVLLRSSGRGNGEGRGRNCLRAREKACNLSRRGLLHKNVRGGALSSLCEGKYCSQAGWP